MREEEQRANVQQVLDELLKEELTPFALTAYSMNTNGRGNTRRFQRQQNTFVSVLLERGENFKQVVRAAVLERVNRISGPLV